MNKVLSQKEIGAILGKARGDTAEIEGSDQRVIQACNFRSGGRMSEPHTRLLTTLYEGFARSVSSSLSAFLRVYFEMVLASVELMPVRDFLAGFQEDGFLATLTLQPAGSAVLMQVDTALVSPIIDVLLGGFGKPVPKSREMTEIDQDIMEGVAQIICRQLETTWQPLGVALHLDRQQKAAQVRGIYSPTEKLTILTFEAKVNETAGAVVLSLPAALASAMLRQISADTNRDAHTDLGDQPGLRERVQNCRFDTTVGIPNLRVPLRDLVALKQGSVLNLRLPVKTAASLILGGREYFEAAPVRSGKQRAAQLLRLASQSVGSGE